VVVADTAEFGSLGDARRPIWTADLSGDGRTDVLFYAPDTQHWWRGASEGTRLQWSVVLNTTKYGEVVHGHVTCVADFTGDGMADVLSYSPSERTWSLGSSRPEDGLLLWRPIVSTLP
ncbi:FG-GAP repeat domain-containing protein, partial [Cellulomonas cellasea]|uniref:FG-GAP repeat domain-containing protein n=1 Tax=Cellulomonas cellasea TaxID=43670 RepID=UPI00114252C1